MEDGSKARAATADGSDGIALVVVPVLLAAMMLVTAAAFAGGEVAAPAAATAQTETAISQN